MKDDRDPTAGAPLGLRAYVVAFTAAGAMAGLALGALEAVERSYAVRRSLRGAAEHLDFALHFALDVPAAVLVSLVAGLVIGTAAISIRRLRARLAGGGNAVRPYHTAAAAALVAVTGAVLGALLAFPLWGVILERFAYYMNLPKANQWEAMAPFLILMPLLPLGVAVLAVDRLLAGRAGRISRGVAFVLLALLGAVAYRGDSAAVIGLSDDSVHLALGIVTAGSAIGCALIAWTALRRSRAVAVALVAAVALSTVAAAAAVRRINADPVVGALFWTRGVLATRPALVVARATDGDGDGFVRAAWGGDPDDRDAASTPLAAEVPGDGVDQNGLGGDPADYAAPDPSDPAAFAHEAPPPGPGRRNVLFITIDTLRADHMSCYGYRRPTTPNIDRFAAGGALFERSVAQSTSTGHSFASMLTGAYADRIFDPAQPRLGALLAERGYQSAWLNAAPHKKFINRDQYWLHYRDIMGTGFTPVDGADARSRQAERLVDDTIAYLDGAPEDRPLFTWVHFRDPHSLYIRHPEFDYGKRAVDRYDSEIAYTDHHLGRLFEYLERSGALADTLVVISSDHGESFGEHGDYTHHRRPYWTLASVPLIARWPGSTGVRVASAAGAVDIAPTIANWAGVAGAAALFDGVDMRWQAAQPAGALAARTVVTETPRNTPEASFLAWSITEGDLHLVYDAYGPRVELFDLAADPLEQRNLATDRPDETARLLALLGRWLDRMSTRPGYSGWAQFQPSMWAAAPRFPPLPPRLGEQRVRGEGGDAE
jgi:arylsulfatase A-like enzyme